MFNVEEPKDRDKMWNNMAKHVTGCQDECIHPNELIKNDRRGRPRKDKFEKKTFWEWEPGKKDKKLEESLEGFLKQQLI